MSGVAGVSKEALQGTGTGADLAVAIDGLTFTYEDAERPALHGISLNVRRGELIVVMGQSGAGKSTLAKCLNRTVPAFQHGEMHGRIAIHGRSIDDLQVADLAGEVGLVLQDFEAQLFATDVVQEVAFGLEQLGVAPREMEERVRESLALVGLEGFEHRDPATLSGGEKQRLAIAAVLAMQPPILVFDEPTTDVDPIGKRDILGILGAMRRRGHTMVVIEHEVEAIEDIDRIVLMHEGAIVGDGPAGEILRDIDLLQRFGVRPRDVDRIAVAFSLPADVSTVDGVEAAMRERRIEPQPLAPTAVPERGEPFVEMNGVGFSYPDSRAVLHDIDFRIDHGEFVALIGQNGSGKTTLAKLANGLLRPQQGQIRLETADLSRMPLTEVAARVGYVFQDPDQQLFAATVRDEVQFGPLNLGVAGSELEQRVSESLEAVGLAGLDEVDPFLLTKGQRQRLAVAALLAQRPRLLILDEPTTGLDYLEQRRMMGLVGRLHRQGIIIVVITHSPWVVAEYAERGVLLSGGRIVFDGPLRELFARESLLEASHFRVPDATRLGNRFGVTALSVEEIIAAAGGERGR